MWVEMESEIGTPNIDTDITDSDLRPTVRSEAIGLIYLAASHHHPAFIYERIRLYYAIKPR